MRFALLQGDDLPHVGSLSHEAYRAVLEASRLTSISEADVTPRIDDNLRRLGALLKVLPGESDRDPPPGLNLPGHTFQQKLVAPPILEAHLSIFYNDHLKGQVVVDYFGHVLLGDLKILDNLRFITEKAREKNPKPMLTLPLILAECGLLLQELPPDHLRSADVRRRWDARNAQPGPAKTPRAADRYYLGIAALVQQQLAAAQQPFLAEVRSRQDVKALLFTDGVLALGDSAEARQYLAAGDFLAASVAAGEALRDLSTPEMLRPHLAALFTAEPSPL
jgi:hypothetical protein